ncbi:MAG TPA: hypothetical protein VF996_03175 [Candidatus Saccharimonadales bacterium]|jgi:hypothetical protein
MEILRKVFHALVVGLLSFVVFTGIAASTFSLVLTNPNTIKSWPIDAGIYPKLTGQLLSATQKPEEIQGEGEAGEAEEALQDALGDSPLDKDRLDRAVSSVFAAGYWQEKFETVIDAFYGWLDGSQPELEFEIAFNDRNAELADALEAELAQQLAEYPRCPAGTNFENFDPLSASCLPQGVSPAKAAKEFSDDIRQKDFLKGAVISSDEIDFDEEFKQSAPSAFAAVSNFPLILALIAGLLVVLAVFSAKSRLRGLRKTGQLLFGIGLVSWLGFFIGNRIGAEFELVKDPGNANEEVFAELGQPLIKTAFEDLTSVGLWVALVVVLVGTLLWLGAFIWHKAHHSSEAEQIAKRAAEQKSKPDPKLPKPVKPDKQ